VLVSLSLFVAPPGVALDLTGLGRRDMLPVMQVTIEIPDELAERWARKRDRLSELVTRTLQREWSPDLLLSGEAIGFLAHGPQPQEIIEFRPSEQSLQRVRELLEKNREGTLSRDEEAELDEISALNRLFIRLKAEARQLLQAA